MTIREAYSIGWATGYDIAASNIPDTGRNVGKSYILDTVLEAESEHYRQFSPFTAHEFNKSRNPDRTWEEYERGVINGASKLIRELRWDRKEKRYYRKT